MTVIFTRSPSIATITIMFPPHLILLTYKNSLMVKSLDRLIQYSARFDEFDRIEVLNFCNVDNLAPEAVYHIDEDRYFLISYCTITHNFTIDAEYPSQLWESDELGVSDDTAYSPERYREIVAACIEDGFDEDFNPKPKIWEAEDLSQGIYSRRRDLAGGRSGSIRALAVPSFGRWAMEEID
jgi:hypothetical protein